VFRLPRLTWSAENAGRLADLDQVRASTRLRNFGIGSIEVAARNGDVVLSGYVPDEAAVKRVSTCSAPPPSRRRMRCV
jgi:hypothetical protein